MTLHGNICRRSIAFAAVVAIAAALVPQSGLSRESQTNSPAYYYIQAVSLLAGIVAPPSNSFPHTFCTTFRISRSDGLPKELAGREIELAYQAPDHLRVRGTWNQQELIIGRSAHQLWFHAPSEKFGLMSSSDAPPTPPGSNNFNALKQTIPFAELMLLPLFANVTALPDEDVETVTCRVIELTAKPDAPGALKSIRGSVRLWLRKDDSMPLRIGYRDRRGTDVQVTLLNPRTEPWPEDRWKLKAAANDHILTAANYFDNYDPAAPLNVSVQETTEINDGEPEQRYSITRFTFDGYGGEKVPSLITRPVAPQKQRLPAIIFLHGIGQNKNFLKVITAPYNRGGFIVTSFDQYTQGERKPERRDSALAALAAFMERPAKTVNEARRLVDYLQTRSDVDPRRIYLVGASYGAIMGSTVLAKDKRIRAGVLVYGGGDFSKLLDSKAIHLGVAAALGVVRVGNLNPEKGPLPELTPSQDRQVAAVLALIKPFVDPVFGVADPVRYASRISPTPVYFQNGTRDSLIAPAAAKALQDAACEPKKITWYDSDHVGFDREQTKQVLEDGLNWLVQQDEKFRNGDN
jgi:dienelactone hydrolase